MMSLPLRGWDQHAHDPGARGGAKEAGALVGQGVHLVRRPRLAHLRAGRHPEAVAAGVRDRHSAHHLLRGRLLHEWLFLSQAGGERVLGAHRHLYDVGLGALVRHLADHGGVGHPDGAGPQRVGGHEAAGAEPAAGLAGLQGDFIFHI